MRAKTFWSVMTADSSQLLERLVSLLRARGAAFCVVGGQAVKAYPADLLARLV